MSIPGLSITTRLLPPRRQHLPASARGAQVPDLIHRAEMKGLVRLRHRASSCSSPVLASTGIQMSSGALSSELDVLFLGHILL